MKPNKNICQDFFYNNKPFFQIVQDQKCTSLQLKTLIIKYSLVNCGTHNRHDFARNFKSLYDIELNPHNYKIKKHESSSLMEEKKQTNSFLMKKLYECLSEYNSIQRKLKEGIENGQIRSQMCRQLGIDYSTSFKLVSKEVKNLSSNITALEDKDLEYFERTHYSGRTITKRMRDILKRVGKLEKYETKKATVVW